MDRDLARVDPSDRNNVGGAPLGLLDTFAIVTASAPSRLRCKGDSRGHLGRKVILHPVDVLSSLGGSVRIGDPAPIDEEKGVMFRAGAFQLGLGLGVVFRAAAFF